MKCLHYNRLIQCVGVLWFTVFFLSMIWIPVEPPIEAPWAAKLRTLNPLMICLKIKSKRVCLEASPSPQHNSKELWSSFIGIGPVLSGGTSLIQMLKMHPQIQVGDRTRLIRMIAPNTGGVDCCNEAELFFFTDENQLSLGLDYYKQFFQPLKPEAKIAGESSPSYSDHPLLPYRIRAMLGPDVKLLFTIRDPVDALLSLYAHRGQDWRLPVPAYFRTLVADQKAYDECLETTITKLFRNFKGTSSTLYYEILNSTELDIHNKMLLDEVAIMCWNRKTGIRHQHERLQHYLYMENLMRWQALLPNQVLCIWSDEFIAHGLDTVNSVLEFLGVDLIQELPANFTPLGWEEVVEEKRKRDLKKDLGKQYKEMCKYLIERNRGLEKLCPRRESGDWGWCEDS